MNCDVLLSLKVLLILANSADPDGPSLFAKSARLGVSSPQMIRVSYSRRHFVEECRLKGTKCLLEYIQVWKHPIFSVLEVDALVKLKLIWPIYE